MLEVEQLSFGFPSRTILDGVSFQVQPGAATCLLGGNGSGKTTLFNLITGGNSSGKSTLLKAIYRLLSPWNTDTEILFRPTSWTIDGGRSQPD